MNADEPMALQQLVQRSDVGEPDHRLRRQRDAFEGGEQAHHPVAAAGAEDGAHLCVRQRGGELTEPPLIATRKVAIARQHAGVIADLVTPADDFHPGLERDAVEGTCRRDRDDRIAGPQGGERMVTWWSRHRAESATLALHSRLAECESKQASGPEPFSGPINPLSQSARALRSRRRAARPRSSWSSRRAASCSRRYVVRATSH